MSLTSAKLILAAAGLVVWGYGVQAENPVMSWLGIAMLAIAAAMRFYRPRSRDQ